jgi:hypothetical protein
MIFQGVLLEYNNTAVESRNYQKKDGVLVAIATIFKILNESKTHKVNLICLYVYVCIHTSLCNLLVLVCVCI